MFSKERLIRLRKEKGWSQEDLGAQMNVSRQAVSRWESGSAVPEVEKLEDLSKLFGVSVGYLLGAEDEIPAAVRSIEPVRKPKGRWILYTFLILMCGVLMSIVLQTKSETRQLREGISQISGQYADLQFQMDQLKSELAETIESTLQNNDSLLADYSLRLVSIDREKQIFTAELTGILKDPANTVDFFAKTPDGSIIHAESVTKNPLNGISCEIKVPREDSIQWYLSCDSKTMKLSKVNNLYAQTKLSCYISGYNNKSSQKEGKLDYDMILTIEPYDLTSMASEKITGTMKLMKDGETVCESEIVKTEYNYFAAPFEIDEVDEAEDDEYLVHVSCYDEQERSYEGYTCKILVTKSEGMTHLIFQNVDARTGQEY